MFFGDVSLNIFDSILQGIVQGLTEFLPISSSGHLLLSQHILGVRQNNLFFDVMLHLGTLIAVIFVYYRLILKLIVAFFQILKDICLGKFNFKKLNYEQNLVIMIILGLLPLFLLFVPIPGADTNIKGLAEKLSEGDSILLVGCSLVITSLLLFIGINADRKNKSERLYIDGKRIVANEKSQLGVSDALAIGLTQCLAAIFPGISRSGSTLSVGLMRGINKNVTLDYSFILGIPAIMAAALLEVKDIYTSHQSLNIGIENVIIGIVVSAVVGFASIKLFKWLLATDKMSIFVWYTFIVGIISIIIGGIEIYTRTNLFTGIPI